MKKQYTHYNPADGAIICRGTFSGGRPPVAPPGFAMLEGVAGDDSTQRVEGGRVVDMPAAATGSDQTIAADGAAVATFSSVAPGARVKIRGPLSQTLTATEAFVEISTDTAGEYQVEITAPSFARVRFQVIAQ